MENLIGQTGFALTALLMSGIVIINGQQFDAISKYNPIPKGSRIIIIGIHMMRPVVRLLD